MDFNCFAWFWGMIRTWELVAFLYTNTRKNDSMIVLSFDRLFRAPSAWYSGVFGSVCKIPCIRNLVVGSSSCCCLVDTTMEMLNHQLRHSCAESNETHAHAKPIIDFRRSEIERAISNALAIALSKPHSCGLLLIFFLFIQFGMLLIHSNVCLQSSCTHLSTQTTHINPEIKISELFVFLAFPLKESVGFFFRWVHRKVFTLNWIFLYVIY